MRNLEEILLRKILLWESQFWSWCAHLVLESSWPHFRLLMCLRWSICVSFGQLSSSFSCVPFVNWYRPSNSWPCISKTTSILAKKTASSNRLSRLERLVVIIHVRLTRLRWQKWTLWVKILREMISPIGTGNRQISWHCLQTRVRVGVQRRIRIETV